MIQAVYILLIPFIKKWIYAFWEMPMVVEVKGECDPLLYSWLFIRRKKNICMCFDIEFGDNLINLRNILVSNEEACSVSEMYVCMYINLYAPFYYQLKNKGIVQYKCLYFTQILIPVVAVARPWFFYRYFQCFGGWQQFKHNNAILLTAMEATASKSDKIYLCIKNT